MADNDKTLNFDFMELHLSKYEGGEVFLSKEYYEEGIAIVYLNHPRKRNAISGNLIIIMYH